MKNILFPLAVAALAAPGYAQTPRTPIQLDAGLGAPVGPAVGSDGELSAIVWKESGTEDMYVSTSTDNGCTWTTALRIDDSLNANGKFAKDLGTVVDGGVIYASWSDQRLVDNEDDLVLTMSSDGGLTWTVDTYIDKGYADGANDLKDWRIAAEGSVVAFMSATENDGGGSHEEVFLTYSTDGGTTFGAAIPVSLHPNGSIDVDAIGMSMVGGVVHMIYVDNTNTASNELFYSSYDTTAGAFLSQDVMISGSFAGGRIENDLAMHANGSTIAVAYQADDLPAGNTQNTIHVNVSTDSGATWNGGIQVGGYTVGTDDTDHPVILVNSNGNITMGWEDNRNGGDELFMATSTDSGATWGESASALAGGFPAIAGDGDYVAMNFTGGPFPEGSFFMSSRDGGVTFGAAVDLAAGQIGDADFAEMAYNASYNNFVTCWHTDDSGANQIFAGGARSAGMTPVGPFTAGGPINFTGAGFGASEAGNEFMVLVSTAKGTAAIPGDGRSTGLVFSSVLAQSAAAPPLKGTILADGTAVTPVVSFPASFAIGTTLSCVALSRAGGSYDAITDVVTFTVE